MVCGEVAGQCVCVCVCVCVREREKERERDREREREISSYYIDSSYCATSHRYFEADGVILVYDITIERSYQDVIEGFNFYRFHVTTSMLVGNECHLSHLRAVPTAKAEEFAESRSAMFIETSFVEDMSGFDTTFLYFVRGQLWNDTL